MKNNPNSPYFLVQIEPFTHGRKTEKYFYFCLLHTLFYSFTFNNSALQTDL